MEFKCNKCGSSNYTTEKHGNNTGLYCSGCGKWYKWLNKDEVRVYSQKYKEEKEERIFNTITHDHFFTIPIECTIVEKLMRMEILVNVQELYRNINIMVLQQYLKEAM